RRRSAGSAGPRRAGAASPESSTDRSSIHLLTRRTRRPAALSGRLGYRPGKDCTSLAVRLPARSSDRASLTIRARAPAAQARLSISPPAGLLLAGATGGSDN